MRAFVAVGLLLGGLVVGLATVALHQDWWGLALGAAATSATLAALPAGWWLRTPFGLGAAVMIGYLALPRPEGDYVIAATARGYLLLGLAVIVLVVAVATLPRRARPRTGRRAPTS